MSQTGTVKSGRSDKARSGGIVSDFALSTDKAGSQRVEPARSAPPFLSETLLQKGLPAALRPEVRECVTSTNVLVKERAMAGEPEGLLLLAAEQTAGHGRFDRRFYSPAGTGAYVSLLLRPAFSPELALRITAAAAVAAAEAIEELTGKRAGIKWVNDVLIGGRKVCGILTEAAFDSTGTRLDYAVLGIGLNVAVPEGGFPPEIAGIAGAVFDRPETGDRERLVAQVLSRFWAYYTALPTDTFMARYSQKSVMPGRRITVRLPDGDRPARALAVEPDGGLRVRYASGEETVLHSGEVSTTLLREETDE